MCFRSNFQISFVLTRKFVQDSNVKNILTISNEFTVSTESRSHSVFANQSEIRTSRKYCNNE
jgi:hypothetical protein